MTVIQRIFQSRVIPTLLFFSAVFILVIRGKAELDSNQKEIYLPIVINAYKAPKLIYSSPNLNGHTVFAECNPGGTSNCPCTTQEASIQFSDAYGEVTSNPRQIRTYVNAIGNKKFVETYPNSEAITLGIVKYRGQIRLPTLPIPDVNQKTNPQAVHFMVQLWDGRNALFPANKYSQEAAVYWDLNPWVTQEYGKVKVYTKPLILTDTGIRITPDTNWHTFEVVVDLTARKYVSIEVDGQTKDLSSSELAEVYHPNWGSEVALVITTESMASWSGTTCDYIFTWTTQFRYLGFWQVK